jgi:KRAB domain-containing zinc finger protein
MNHRIEKLSTLLNSNVTQLQLNVQNENEISIQREDVVNGANDNNSCSSTKKVKPLLIVQKSNRFKVASSIRKHKCETCNKRFLHLCHLNIHNRMHSKKKRFACDQCQMSFSTKGNLSRHKRTTHSGEKPYQCDICKKTFGQSNDLTKHKRTHTGEKPYQCDLCPKKFAQSNDLTKHKRIHSGEKPYSCDLCQKKFSQLSNLTNHKRLHSGEKPYECGSCHKKFSDPSNLISHKKIHA